MQTDVSSLVRPRQSGKVNMQTGMHGHDDIGLTSASIEWMQSRINSIVFTSSAEIDSMAWAHMS